MIFKFKYVVVVIDACLLLKSDKLAFTSKAVCVALEIGLFASVALSTLPSPTINLVMPLTVPVQVGLASGAFKSSAPCVALEIGLLASVVLSTLPRPTIALVIPLTVPVKVGLASGAFELRAHNVAVDMVCLSLRCYRRCRARPWTW